jgi:hypothetical protein
MENKTEFKVGQRVMMVGTVELLDKNGNIESIDWGNGIGVIQPYTEPFREREMMVSDDKTVWCKKTVISNINGQWQSKAVNSFGVARNYKYAKEIEEPKTEEKYTVEEIIDKLK